VEQVASPPRARQRVVLHHVVVVVAALAALSAFVGCSDSPNRATGQVDSASFGRLCFTPESNDRHDLEGCWSIGAEDAAGIEQSDCIEARFPGDKDGVVTEVRLLDRECHLGVEPEADTGNAIQALIWIVAVSAALAFCAAIPLRRYLRNNPTPIEDHPRR
jgi:hypothetical protein